MISYKNVKFPTKTVNDLVFDNFLRYQRMFLVEDLLQLSPFLMPKQEVHSLKDTCLSLSASHSWKKREVQCSIGTRGTLSGASSEWDKTLQRMDQYQTFIIVIRHFGFQDIPGRGHEQILSLGFANVP